MTDELGDLRYDLEQLLQQLERRMYNRWSELDDKIRTLESRIDELDS